MSGNQRVMTKSQHKLAPLAGSTMLFQSAERCLPARHFTRLAHAKLAKPARMKALIENSGSKPGASLETLIAGCAGKPVCKEIQTVQMIKAPTLKNKRVNQSMKALTLRLSVGNANAAKVANAGKPMSSERSLKPDNQVLAMATLMNQRGNDKWGLAEILFSW